MNTLFNTRRQQRGAAMFVALMVTTLGLGLILAVTELNKINNDGSDESLSRQNCSIAATAALNMVFSDIWGRYQVAPHKHFQNYTDRFGSAKAGFLQDAVWSRYPQLANVGTHDLTANFAGRRFGSATISQARVVRTNLQTGLEPVSKFVFEVEVTSDDVDQSDPNKNPMRAWAARTITAAFPAPYEGFDFAILTKNITCTYCHLKVQDINKAHKNGTPNTFVRTKVGTTEYMAIRPGSAESNIEGTIYQRGKFESEQDSTAAPLTMTDLTGSTLRGVEFHPGKITVKQDTSTTGTKESTFTNAGINPATGAPYPRESAYLQYPTDPKKMDAADGTLPTDFPAPFKDLNNNRKVDAAEIAEAKLTAVGTITGGIARTVAAGQPYTAFKDGTGPSSRLPTPADLSAGKVDPANITGSTAGTVVLVGTYDNPIRLAGKVVIEGDVIIKGYVEGNGEVWATGNVYAPGDVRYKNKIDTSTGKEVFGTNESGGKNLLGLMAGKSIVIGDYLSQVNHWSTDDNHPKFHNFGVPEPGRKLNNFPLPYTDTQGSQDSGMYAAGATAPNGATVGNYGKVNFANFVAEDMAFFNREELTKNLLKVPTAAPRTKFYDSTTPFITNGANYGTSNTSSTGFYDPNYVPRYYNMYPTLLPSVEAKANLQLAVADAVLPAGDRRTTWTTEPNVYLSDKTNFSMTLNAATGKSQGWSNTKDPHTYNTVRKLSEVPATADIRGPQDANKAIINIHPEWITPGDMFSLLMTEEAARPAEPRRFDGLMYTNNAIFAIERPKTQAYSGTWNETTQTFTGGTWSKVNSKSGGKMILNGAIIAPDLGVLVTGGTNETTSPFANATPIYRGGTLKYVQKAFTVNYDPRVQEIIAPLNEDAAKWALTEFGVSQGFGTLPP